MAGILYSFFAQAVDGMMAFHTVKNAAHLDPDGNLFPVPPSILLGMTAIVLVGLLDDVMGISPRVKLGGQLLAAAALAIDDVGRPCRGRHHEARSAPPLAIPTSSTTSRSASRFRFSSPPVTSTST
jgi:UDP-N-acetylmuramyl pentapeptide phosphotransferase/UDP-N-acetylglucosamine-1-phosphate transferase